MPVDPLSYVLVEGEPPADGQPLQPPAAAAAAEPPPAPLPSRPCSPARYTRSLLRQALQLMGLKPRQSDKAAQKAFLILQQRAALPPGEPLSLAARRCAAPGGHAGVTLTRAEFNRLVIDCLASPATAATEGAFAAQLAAPAVAPANQQQAALAEAAQQATAAAQPSPTQQQQQAAAAQHAPAPLPPAPDPLTDFRIACSLREQRASVAVLLCGTSGTGEAGCCYRGAAARHAPSAADGSCSLSAADSSAVLVQRTLRRPDRPCLPFVHVQASRRWRPCWRLAWASPPSCRQTPSVT